MLADPEIHGVVIAAPAELHADIAIRAFEAGKHVFVEKPLALSESDGLRMEAAAKRAGRILMVGHLLQYHPAFVRLLELAEGGELGRILYVYSHRLSLGKFRVEENAVWSLAPHDVSMILALFGEEPCEVHATLGDGITAGVADWGRIDLEFSGGAKAHVFASWLHPFKEHRLTVVGDRAMAVFEDSVPGPEKLVLYRHEIDASHEVPRATKHDPELVAYPLEEPLKSECSHFLECMHTGATPRTDGEEGLRVLRTLLRATSPAQDRTAHSAQSTGAQENDL
jgi:UDP-2-acetamido-3-amino-2,3-dideoxy-glucuronate N-acetyltransferase